MKTVEEIMLKRSSAVLVAYSIGLLALTITSNHSSVHGQPADLALCDRVAADPTDPDKPADIRGTSDIAQSDIATAIRYCRVASAKSRRALYQLGRAYAANPCFSRSMTIRSCPMAQPIPGVLAPPNWATKPS